MEQLEKLGPMSEGVFLPSRIGEGLHTSCPEVGAKADCGQVSEIGKESGGRGDFAGQRWVHDAGTWTDTDSLRFWGEWIESQENSKMK